MHCGAGGGSRTHFSHPFLDAYYGLLRDVSAARRLSRSAFGGRANPGLVSPRQFGPGLLEPYKLVENRGCLSRLREYLVPCFVGYLPGSVFCMDVPDQQSAWLEDRHSVKLSVVYKDGLGACDH